MLFVSGLGGVFCLGMGWIIFGVGVLFDCGIDLVGSDWFVGLDGCYCDGLEIGVEGMLWVGILFGVSLLFRIELLCVFWRVELVVGV